MQELPAERAIALLHPAPQLGVCIFAHGIETEPRIEIWDRARVEALIFAKGAMVAGPNAREANFGLCCMTAPGQYAFFETAHS